MASMKNFYGGAPKLETNSSGTCHLLLLLQTLLCILVQEENLATLS